MPTTTSAPRSKQCSAGTLLTQPPSMQVRPWPTWIGGRTPGIAQEARTATRREPRSITTSSPEPMSAATAAKGTGRSSIRRSGTTASIERRKSSGAMNEAMAFLEGPPGSRYYSL